MPPVLRILHVTPYAGGAWAYGGIPRVVAAMAAGAAARGHQVTVCATDAGTATERLDGATRRSRAWPAVQQDDGVTLRVFPNISNAAAYHAQCFVPLGLDRYLRAHAHEFDVAHLHACRNFPGVVAARHLVAAGVPYILGPNGTAPNIERRRFAKSIFDRLFGRTVVNGAARILAVTESERRSLLELGVADERIDVVPNPVDLDEFSPLPPRGFLRNLGIPAAAPVVLFLGKITPRKRLDVLVRAFAGLADATAAFADARLVIAGNDMGGDREARALVSALGLGARTHFTGLLTGRDRLAALADASVVVYPSQDEIFGLVPLEALLAGTAVIVADDSGCGEVISAIDGGPVVPVGDVSALHRAMVEVLSDGGRVARVAGAAQRVRERYGRDVVSGSLEQVYRRAVAPTRALVAAPSPRPGFDDPAPQEAGVSFVVPIHNGAAFVERTLEAVAIEAQGRPFEILVVDDRSTDATPALLQSLSARIPLRILTGPGRGSAAAINTGILASRFPLIAQVDQDVAIHRGWLHELVTALEDPRVAAAQGHYQTDPAGSLSARVMGLDLEDRYARMSGSISHVCTGNTVYRKAALLQVGLFDEALGYGSDNDISYRLREAGHRLAYRPAARSLHRWREGVSGYLRQQYGFGYGRLDLVAKHPGRRHGDSVSPASMMLHPLVMAIALLLAVTAAAAGAAGLAWALPASASLALLAALALERLLAGVRAWRRSSDAASLLFPVVHLARDAAWVLAIVIWTIRRVSGVARLPRHSMGGRPSSAAHPSTLRPRALRTLAIIPAHNEAANLPSVIADLRLHQPDVDILVVDDGSSDGTTEVLEELGVRWLRWADCRGVGAAVRAGLLYAVRSQFTAVVRVDADGQHHAGDIDRLLAPIRSGQAEVVLGTRYAEPVERRDARGLRVVQRVLGAWIAALTSHSVTDPTSGFCALGPRAVRLLAEHHPNGYPEPELRLFLSRNSVRILEVPVRARVRLSGKTSLTPGRLFRAAARVLLALLIVPVRPAVETQRD